VRKYLFILMSLILVMTFFGCVTLKKGALINNNEIAVLTNVVFEPPYTKGNIVTIMLIGKLRNKLYDIMDFGGGAKLIENDKMGKYFIFKIPKEKLYIRTITSTLLSTNFWVNYYVKTPLHFTAESNFIYIGDIIITTDKDTNEIEMKVIDNFERIKDDYSGYLKNTDGSSLRLEKSLIDPYEDIIAEYVQRTL
jgi:hypothetical protein